jgi:hypothetical protein
LVKPDGVFGQASSFRKFANQHRVYPQLYKFHLTVEYTP